MHLVRLVNLVIEGGVSRDPPPLRPKLPDCRPDWVVPTSEWVFIKSVARRSTLRRIVPLATDLINTYSGGGNHQILCGLSGPDPILVPDTSRPTNSQSRLATPWGTLRGPLGCMQGPLGRIWGVSGGCSGGIWGVYGRSKPPKDTPRGPRDLPGSALVPQGLVSQGISRDPPGSARDHPRVPEGSR